ncbi:hypothetical protein AZH53_02180 [Methanomicrobiaceae archaeon CYW5]|uniref:hypothetical protein n=1 Tax=Methanovulcanius yangii TaxID=1789227 RepID=UPI0029C9BC8C|nr:hypothetical protein [Methanovulcanius yangii]MBT8507237.1 hypothetical protein [Methanovulcanius yangii]
MDLLLILSGGKDPLAIFSDIVPCLENINTLPLAVEPIYHKAVTLTAEDLDHLHFGLVRIQIYADIHRYENIDEMQKIKYVSQILEKVIFGMLMLESEPIPSD